MKWLYKIENYVIDSVRVFLLLTGGLMAAASLILLLWAGFAAFQPTETDIRDNLKAPTFAELRSRLLPVASESASNSPIDADQGSQVHDSPFEGRLRAVTETLDKQYNLVGREEKKFSESYSSERLEALLIERDLEEYRSNNSVMDHYLDSLQKFASDLSNDAMVSRIADTAARTSLILNAINEFQAEYLYALDISTHAALVESSQAKTAKASLVTSLLWLLLGAGSIFFAACLVLVVFRIERILRNNDEGEPA